MSKDNGQQLRTAARDGDLAGVKKALQAGASIDAKSEWNDTALNEAADAAHFEIVEHLLASGAHIENKGGADKTPLANAALAGHPKVVVLLLDKGARVTRDLLSMMHIKAGALEANAESGMVRTEAAQAWRRFLDFMVAKWNQQNPPAATAEP